MVSRTTNSWYYIIYGVGDDVSAAMVFGDNGTWNRGIVEWATMINDPVPHLLIQACAHYASQLEQSEHRYIIYGQKDKREK